MSCKWIWHFPTNIPLHKHLQWGWTGTNIVHRWIGINTVNAVGPCFYRGRIWQTEGHSLRQQLKRVPLVDILPKYWSKQIFMNFIIILASDFFFNLMIFSQLNKDWIMSSLYCMLIPLLLVIPISITLSLFSQECSENAINIHIY